MAAPGRHRARASTHSWRAFAPGRHRTMAAGPRTPSSAARPSRRRARLRRGRVPPRAGALPARTDARVALAKGSPLAPYALGVAAPAARAARVPALRAITDTKDAAAEVEEKPDPALESDVRPHPARATATFPSAHPHRSRSPEPISKDRNRGGGGDRARGARVLGGSSGARASSTALAPPSPLDPARASSTALAPPSPPLALRRNIPRTTRAHLSSPFPPPLASSPPQPGATTRLPRPSQGRRVGEGGLPHRR